MNKNEIANNIVKESLTDALFTLMSNKEFNDITITELSKKAGVSRLSFYRNYTSKEEIIIKYLDDNYQGDIVIGGYDLKNIDIFSLRNNICYVSQNEYPNWTIPYVNNTSNKVNPLIFENLSNRHKIVK